MFVLYPGLELVSYHTLERDISPRTLQCNSTLFYRWSVIFHLSFIKFNKNGFNDYTTGGSKRLASGITRYHIH